MMNNSSMSGQPAQMERFDDSDFSAYIECTTYHIPYFHFTIMVMMMIMDGVTSSIGENLKKRVFEQLASPEEGKHKALSEL